MLKNLLNYFWLLDKLSIKQLLAVARETSASLLVDYTIWDSQIVSRGDSWSFLRFSIWACQIVDIQRVRHQGNCYCIIPVRLCGRCGLRCSVESNAPWAKSFGDACAFPLRPFWDRRAFAEAFSFPDAPKSIASLLPTSYRRRRPRESRQRKFSIYCCGCRSKSWPILEVTMWTSKTSNNYEINKYYDDVVLINIRLGALKWIKYTFIDGWLNLLKLICVNNKQDFGNFKLTKKTLYIPKYNMVQVPVSSRSLADM